MDARSPAVPDTESGAVRHGLTPLPGGGTTSRESCSRPTIHCEPERGSVVARALSWALWTRLRRALSQACRDQMDIDQTAALISS
jgi:hypothetical protein